MSEVTLEFLAEQVKRVLDKQENARVDMDVLVAVIRRLDATVASMTDEIRALHGQIGRFAHRLDLTEANK